MSQENSALVLCLLIHLSYFLCYFQRCLQEKEKVVADKKLAGVAALTALTAGGVAAYKYKLKQDEAARKAKEQQDKEREKLAKEEQARKEREEKRSS